MPEPLVWAPDGNKLFHRSNATNTSAMDRAALMKEMFPPPRRRQRHPLFWCYYLFVFLLMTVPFLVIYHRDILFLREAQLWFEDGQNLWRPEEISEWYYFTLWGLLLAVLLYAVSLSL